MTIEKLCEKLENLSYILGDSDNDILTTASECDNQEILCKVASLLADLSREAQFCANELKGEPIEVPVTDHLETIAELADEMDKEGLTAFADALDSCLISLGRGEKKDPYEGNNEFIKGTF